MRRVKYKYSVPKYNNGGVIGKAGALGQVGAVGGGMLMANPYNANGSVNDGRYIAGSALTGAGSGVAAGAAFGIPGMIVGGALGLGAGLYKGITGSKDLMKERDAQLAEEERLKQEQEAQATELEKQRVEFEKQQQDNYNKSYYAANSMKGYNVNLYAKGGLLPLATDVFKAEGAKHENGGIDLQANGKVFAEVEDDEIIHGNRVFSDRTKLGNKTYAEHAEKLGKNKAKFEEMVQSGNFRKKNTAERMLANIDNDLDQLFITQEAGKDKTAVAKFDLGGMFNNPLLNSNIQQVANMSYRPGEYDKVMAGINPADAPEGMEGGFWQRSQAPAATGGYDPTISNVARTSGGVTPAGGGGESFDWAGAASGLAGMAVPFIDNIYNANIIKKTPEIPKPIMREAMNLRAMPMKTRVDVSGELANINDSYRDFRNNIDQNTANSNVSRANKITGFAKTLQAKNDTYSRKNMTETDLVNRNNMNIQNVDNINIKNRQDITNQNHALTDGYNMAKVMRDDNILRAKSQNVANITDDAINLVQDSNMRQLDDERIMTDSLRYNDASGYARLIGSPTMNRMMKNPQYYNQVEKALRESGQTKAHSEFVKKYGKK